MSCFHAEDNGGSDDTLYEAVNGYGDVEELVDDQGLWEYNVVDVTHGLA